MKTVQQVKSGELVEDKIYKVIFNDCCITGGFTSKLVKRIMDEDDPTYLVGYKFENDVELWDCWGCIFEELEEEK